MKKETRTTRLLSKKQGQKVVALGMVVTLFAPLLLAPIANAEEVQTTETSEIAQQPAEATQPAEAPVIQEIQTPEEIVTPPAEETIVSEPVVEPIQTEIVDEAPVVESTKPVIVDTTPDSQTQPTTEITETPETTSPTTDDSAIAKETSNDSEFTPDPNVVAEFQGILAGYEAQMAELEAMGANNDITLWHEVRGVYSSIAGVIDLYTQGASSEESTRSDLAYSCPTLDRKIQELSDYLSQNPTINVTGVSLSELPELTIGKTHQLTATVTPTNATNTGVSFSSSNPNIATVDANGQVTAVSAGSYSITVTTADGGFTATANGTVKEAPVNPEIPATGITISKSETSLKIGESEDLTATITPDNATNKKVTWSSSDESVATVVNGKVTAKRKGTATITATSEDGGKTATCVVTVTEEVIPPVEKLNLDALKAAIAAANPLKEADYTPESWKPFAEAKVNAEAVLAKAEAQNTKAALTQADVNGATKALTDTQSKLVKKTTSGNNGNNGSGNNNGGNTGGNNSGSGTNSGNNGSGNASGNGSTNGTNPGDSANNANAGNKSGNQANGKTVSADTKPSSNKDDRIGNTAAKENTLPQAGEIQTSTTLLGIILVGIASIGTFLFKRKQSH